MAPQTFLYGENIFQLRVSSLRGVKSFLLVLECCIRTRKWSKFSSLSAQSTAEDNRPSLLARLTMKSVRRGVVYSCNVMGEG